ncbi:MAG: hypothetical protein WDA71_08155 [Actinomycetota bacterium]
MGVSAETLPPPVPVMPSTGDMFPPAPVMPSTGDVTPPAQPPGPDQTPTPGSTEGIPKGRKVIPIQLRVLAPVFAAAVAALLLWGYRLGKDWEQLVWAFLMVASVCVVALFLVAAVRLATGPRRKVAVVWVMVSALLAVGLAVDVGAYERTRARRDAALIQDYLTQSAVIRSLASSAATGKSTSMTLRSLSEWAARVVSDIRALKVRKGMADYLTSVADWAGQMAAATTREAWTAVPAQPSVSAPSFTIPGSGADQVKRSLEKLKVLHEFGSYAIARKDAGVMPYVGARIAAQQDWLARLALPNYTEDAGRVAPRGASLLALGVEAPVSASAKVGSCVTIWSNGKGWVRCARDASGALGPVIRSAYGYRAEEAATTETWNESWQQFEDITGYPIGGVGITPGTPEERPPSALDEFWAECKAKGGRAATTSVKTRLPTTEGGWTCEYPSGANTCWDFMTYSGGRYMGGNGGCPEMNLVPRVITGPWAIFGGGGSQTWDGVYSFNVSAMRCTGMFAGASYPSIPGGSLQVKNNRVQAPGFNGGAIDSGGQATLTMSVSASVGMAGAGGWAGATPHMQLRFSRSSDGVKVAGQFGFESTAHSESGGKSMTVSGSCTSDVSGRRVSG